MTQENSNLGWVGLTPHLLNAQKQVESVHKASKNDFGGYMYASAEDMITASRQVLHKEGLIVTRNGWRVIDEEGKTPIVEAVYVLAHKDGHNVACVTQYPICAGKGRPEDKALNASLTTGMSYFLRDLLLIPRCDEEVDSRQDTIARSGTRKTPTPKSAKTASKNSMNNRTKFMGAVAQWLNKDISEDSTTMACVRLLNLLSFPTDGTATSKQFAEATKYVEKQISEGQSPSGIDY